MWRRDEERRAEQKNALQRRPTVLRMRRAPAVNHEDREEKKNLLSAPSQIQPHGVDTVLLECLDDLREDELERFHFYLNNELPEGYKSIPKSHLEGQSRTSTVRKMLKRYGRNHAWRVTVHILRKMNLNEEAKSLQMRIDTELHRGGREPLLTIPAPVGPPPVVATEKQTPPFSAGLTPMVTKDRQPNPEPILNGADEALRAVQRKLRANLKTRYERIFEGVAKQGRPALLAKVFTEVFITEGGYGNVNTEHEVWYIEAEHKKPLTDEVRIECNRIFQPLPGEDVCVRSVLTKGIAGIGKTVSVQKFILDWAEGKANEEIDLIFPLPFRELNLMKAKEFSLLELIQHYHPELKDCKMIDLSRHKVLLIFDGLDECRLPLDFDNNEPWYEVTQPLSVDVLLTNLIQGNLLPSALLWITSRPAAANQIPPECIHRVAEVRGFDDPQKEEYFRKRFSDQTLASRIITHIISSRSLFIMCHIPIFCWISATVLERLMEKSEGGEIPKTLTEMYTHFLLIQISIKDQKYYRGGKKNTDKLQESDKEIIVNLGKLAFLHLEKNNLIFYEEDLTEAGIEDSKISEYSGLYTDIFSEEPWLFEKKTFCFVHLSIQEYLAALSVHLLYVSNRENPLNLDMSRNVHSDGAVKLSEVHRAAVDKALQSKSGHLDLFLRFLLGLSIDSQARLGCLQPQTGSNSQSIKETIRYIKTKISNSSPERAINLFHCLNELNDNSLVEEIQHYIDSNSLSNEKLSPDECSALAYVLLMSEKQVERLDLRMYNTTQSGYRRLLPVVKHSKTALLQYCDLTPALCEPVNLVLQSPTSLLRELDLGYNMKLGDKGAKLLCSSLLSHHCRLHTLGLGDCSLTAGCCKDLASVLCLPHSELRELELRDNDLLDSGVEALCAGLRERSCKLQKLGLSGCGVTERGCASLASALKSNPSHLRELDLSYNHPGESGVRTLSAGLEDPNYKLEKLITDHGGQSRLKQGMRKYGSQLTLDSSTAFRSLVLSDGGTKVNHKYGYEEKERPANSLRFESDPQVLCNEALTGRCYWEVEWDGVYIDVGVAYKEILRNSVATLGLNAQSWALHCDRQVFTVFHDNKGTNISRRKVTETPRVGVNLDWANGTVAFYKITPKGQVHLHTFHTTFTQPLYPAFSICQDTTLSLCQLD
ncbi:hypothetical protein AGOR_G00192010 [Albula goreensis]|uniref:Uncharacterized protein n=1 Tax=Albula goreensis TaxID=1534307 RepID=A0A8T3CVG0_9TELE|nr:hypothetical protein AGOR_G00192010 [Albula goreensis]